MSSGTGSMSPEAANPVIVANIKTKVKLVVDEKNSTSKEIVYKPTTHQVRNSVITNLLKLEGSHKVVEDIDNGTHRTRKTTVYHTMMYVVCNKEEMQVSKIVIPNSRVPRIQIYWPSGEPEGMINSPKRARIEEIVISDEDEIIEIPTGENLVKYLEEENKRLKQQIEKMNADFELRLRRDREDRQAEISRLTEIHKWEVNDLKKRLGEGQ